MLEVMNTGYHQHTSQGDGPYARSGDSARWPLVFHLTALNFWNSLKRPRRRPHSNSQLRRDLTYAEALRMLSV
jgi:hypothetical protein